MRMSGGALPSCAPKEDEDMKHIKDNNYITIPAIFRTQYNLNCNEMMIASIIYGFSQDGKSSFTGSLAYLQEWTSLTKQGILKILAKLVDMGIIEKEVSIINGVRYCAYKTIIDGGKLSLIGVNSVEQGGKLSLTGGIKLSLPNNIDIDNKDNNILTNVSSTDTTTNEAKPKDNEKENTASAIPEKKAKKLESSDIAAAADPASRYGKFLLWMRQDTPYCYKNLTLPTEKQFEKLLNDYGGESVKDIVEEIENRKDKRKNYSNLNLTIRNWMKYRESKKQ